MSDTPEVPLTPDIDDFTRGQLMLEIVREVPVYMLPLSGHYHMHALLGVIAKEKPGVPMMVTPGMSLIRFIRKQKPELWKKVRPFVQPGSKTVYTHVGGSGGYKAESVPYKL